MRLSSLEKEVSLGATVNSYISNHREWYKEEFHASGRRKRKMQRFRFIYSAGKPSGKLFNKMLFLLIIPNLEERGYLKAESL